MTRRSILSVILALIICIGIFPAASAENAALTDEQANAIAMLSYITVLTQDINASKNSRLYMEEAYSSLINNTFIRPIFSNSCTISGDEQIRTPAVTSFFKSSASASLLTYSSSGSQIKISLSILCSAPFRHVRPFSFKL